MKTTLLISFLFVTSFSFAQKTLAVKAGTTYSYIRHVESDFDLGYYAGAVYEDQVNDVLAVVADLYFLDQRYTVQDVSASVKSINLAMGVNLYVANSGFYFTVGPEIGNTIQVKVDGETSDTPKDFRFSYVAGLGYKFGKLGIMARYVGALHNQQSEFDFNIQCGLTYKVF